MNVNNIKTIYESLAKSELPIVRQVISRRPWCPQPILRRLASDPDDWVRTFVAQNPSTDDDTLLLLKDDTSDHVREALTVRSKSLSSIIDSLKNQDQSYSFITDGSICKSEPRLRGFLQGKWETEETKYLKLALDPSTDINFLSSLSLSGSEEIRIAALLNSSCPSTVRQSILSNQTSWEKSIFDIKDRDTIIDIIRAGYFEEFYYRYGHWCNGSWIYLDGLCTGTHESLRRNAVTHGLSRLDVGLNDALDKKSKKYRSDINYEVKCYREIAKISQELDGLFEMNLSFSKGFSIWSAGSITAGNSATNAFTRIVEDSLNKIQDKNRNNNSVMRSLISRLSDIVETGRCRLNNSNGDTLNIVKNGAFLVPKRLS